MRIVRGGHFWQLGSIIDCKPPYGGLQSMVQSLL